MRLTQRQRRAYRDAKRLQWRSGKSRAEILLSILTPGQVALIAARFAVGSFLAFAGIASIVLFLFLI